MRIAKEFDNIFDKLRNSEEHQVNRVYAKPFGILPMKSVKVANATSREKNSRISVVKQKKKGGGQIR